MTTPSTYSTCERIIAKGMTDAGKLAKGDNPTSEDFADGINRLNDIINYEQIDGLKLWLQDFQTIPLVVGQALYTLGPGGTTDMTKPTRITAAMFNDPQSLERPLNLISWDEYNRLNDKTTPGTINSIFVDKQRDTLNVYFWYPPDTNAALGTVVLTLQRQCTNMVQLTDTVDFPVEWVLFLSAAYANEIAFGQPQTIQMRCKMRYKEMKEKLSEWDVEDADTSFQPGYFGQGQNNSFS